MICKIIKKTEVKRVLAFINLAKIKINEMGAKGNQFIGIVQWDLDEESQFRLR